MTIRIIESKRPLTDPAVAAVRDRLRAGDITGTGDSSINVRQAVADAIADVRARGDQSVVDLTRRLHKVEATPGQLRIARGRIARCHKAADAAFLRLVRRVIANIRQYQRSILVRTPPTLKRGGRRLGVRYAPVDRVCVYVPGGKALYPSTVLMTVVPAQVAGVREVCIVSPPGPDGRISDMVLALAGELGVGEVYCAAGVAALAALAIGTKAFPKVDKIVGPGSAFIAEAKRQLLGLVGIDSIAGPSEVLIVADESARADWVAADMLAQAEHDPGSAILVTTSRELAEGVQGELERQVAALERAAATRAAIDKYSAIIVVPTIEQACEVANAFATEHLQVVVRKSRHAKALKLIRHAGAIFIGPSTPVPLGDYVAGPSHVLPTGGTARFFSPLSCNDFLKSSSLIEYDAAALAADAPDVAAFARLEGLTAHARAVEVRSMGVPPMSTTGVSPVERRGRRRHRGGTPLILTGKMPVLRNSRPPRRTKRR